MAEENRWDRSSVDYSSVGEGRRRSWGVLVDLWEDNEVLSLSLSEGLSKGSSGVLGVLQRRGFS